MLNTYWTVIVPFEPDPRKRTEWHPTEPTGPFATLSRGRFETLDAAFAWGYSRLGSDATFTVRKIDLCPLCGEDRMHPTQTIRSGHRC